MSQLKEIVTLTEPAILEIKNQISKDGRDMVGIRLGVKGGGCSGLSYVLDLGFEKEHDYIQEVDGVKLFIDRKSALYLKDMMLDYKDAINDKGFKFKNPNAVNTCGCGESFSI